MEKYDLIVVGGGFAGFGAAVAAAREGAKTLLIERTNCLGGAASGNLVLPFMPYLTKIPRPDGTVVSKRLSRGIFEEVVNELEVLGKIQGRQYFHDEYLKLVLNRMAIKSGVELLFGVTVTDIKRHGDRITSLTAYGKGKKLEFSADYFIDATGDANILAAAGFPFRLGREEDGLCQPMTLCFRMIGVDIEKYTEEKPHINELYIKLKEEGKIRNPRENVLIFKTLMPGTLHFNTTRVVKLDPTDPKDVTKAEIEAREQVFEMVDFLKANFEAFKNAELMNTAIEIGARESRMADGEYVLTGDELKACCRFDDSIACGNYDIDIHNPAGSGTSHYYFPAGEYYQIPYRSLIPKNAENLLVAGRCISVDHYAQASVRIMPIVCCLGEAAGTAAAIAVKSRCFVKDVDIGALQTTLRKNGAAID